jgi:hypothetical protein
MKTVAQIVGFENVFDATVTALHEPQGTMLCRLETGPRLAPRSESRFKTHSCNLIERRD